MDDMIKGLKAGKQEAWNMMIDNYSKKVYNLALNFAGNSDDASDITQDIFLKVYNNIDIVMERDLLTKHFHSTFTPLFLWILIHEVFRVDLYLIYSIIGNMR